MANRTNFRVLLGGTLLALFLLSACAPTSKPTTEAAKVDPTGEVEYAEATQKLGKLAIDANAHYKAGRREEAGKLVTEGQPLIRQVLQPSHPTLEAMQAVSDLDQLYGEMLLENRHYGFARELLQKNVARWKHWKPETEDTRRRLKEATDAIARCDRAMASGK